MRPADPHKTAPRASKDDLIAKMRRYARGPFHPNTSEKQIHSN
jgi:hypothetical protein